MKSKVEDWLVDLSLVVRRAHMLMCTIVTLSRLKSIILLMVIVVIAAVSVANAAKDRSVGGGGGGGARNLSIETSHNIIRSFHVSKLDFFFPLSYRCFRYCFSALIIMSAGLLCHSFTSLYCIRSTSSLVGTNK